jgi:hypothetical protein
MRTANTNPSLNQLDAGTELDPMSSALFNDGLSLRYISLRARKVPKLKQPALIWLNDMAKGGRGPKSYHEEFLSALFKAAGAVFIFPNGVSKDQQQGVVDAAFNTGCSVVVLTTPRCVEAWTQVVGLTKLNRKN